MPYFEKVIPYYEKVIPYQEKAIPYSEKVIPYQEKVIPYYENAIPYYKDETIYDTTKKTLIIYMNKKTGQLYIPTEKTVEKDQPVVTIMHKPCYEITYADLDKYKDEKIIIASVYVVEKKVYNFIICNNNGQLFISQSVLRALGFYIENPHRIIINKEIYEEITEEDLELIKGLESDTLHINITMKQIAPKRG